VWPILCDPERRAEPICNGLICPTGWLVIRLSSPFRKNIPVLSRPKSLLYPPPSRPEEGRIAIVTDVGHGMRWTRAALLTRALTSRTEKSCGPDAPTLASSWRKTIPLMTVANKPGHRGATVLI